MTTTDQHLACFQQLRNSADQIDDTLTSIVELLPDLPEADQSRVREVAAGRRREALQHLRAAAKTYAKTVKPA